MASSATTDMVKEGREIMRMKQEGRIGRALQRGEELAMEDPESPTPHCLIGAIHYAAAIRAREAAAGAAALAETHLRSARNAITKVNSIAPDNIDNHIALAGVLVELSMFREAETALRRAWDLEANPLVATQGLYNRPVSSTHDAKNQSYERLTNGLMDHEIQQVSEMRNSHGGALNALKEARSLAKRFPGSVRARLFEALIELEYMKSLPRDLDRTKGVERLLQIAKDIAEAFPKSAVSASFRARLLFLSGKHDDAEAECHRALSLVDLKEDTILPASIRGDKGEFHDLLSKIMTKRQMAGAGGRPCQKITADDIATIFSVDQLSSKEEVSFPTVVYWTNVRADLRSFREILNEYVRPVMTFAYNSGTAVYSLAAMICYLDGCCVDIVRADGCWIMYDEAGGVEKCLCSWEFMLEVCRKYWPSVLFYEVIK